MQFADQFVIRVAGKTGVGHRHTHFVQSLSKQLCAFCMFNHTYWQVGYAQIDIEGDLGVHGWAQDHQHTSMQVH